MQMICYMLQISWLSETTSLVQLEILPISTGSISSDVWIQMGRAIRSNGHHGMKVEARSHRSVMVI